MLEMTIQVPEPLAEELVAVQDRLPEVLAYGLQQLSPLPGEIYQYILEFMVSRPSQEELLRFAPTPAMQARVSFLLEKNRSGELAVAESKELDEYMRINHLITMLKARGLPLTDPIV
ncbi:MAG: hypothetical protein R3C14_36905 [Caldilineaceae bacterium]